LSGEERDVAFEPKGIRRADERARGEDARAILGVKLDQRCCARDIRV
jgi:hypothetical protein